MADLIDRAAEEKIAKQAMSVRGHGDQIALSILGDFQNSVGGLAESEKGVDVQTALPKGFGGCFQIRAIVLHFIRFDQVELIVISRNEPIRDMDEKQLGLMNSGKLTDVRKQSLIGATIFEGDKNFSIHD
jgi:hypothetical protein